MGSNRGHWDYNFCRNPRTHGVVPIFDLDFDTVRTRRRVGLLANERNRTHHEATVA